MNRAPVILRAGISCAYIARVPTGSARYSKLIYASRTDGNWVNQIVAEYDDGYHGRDGRDYTGGLTHLVFDRSDNPHIAFTDIASSHGPSNYFNLGNIRYAALKDGSWDISTIYRQPLPNSFYDATEMYGLCLLIPKNTNSIHMIGQEIEVYNEHEYHVELTHHVIKGEHSSEEPDFSNMMISYLPHFSMVENAWSTQLSLANPYDEPQDVLVAAYNEMGALNTYTTLQIPGKGGRSEPIDRLMPELNISRGWLKIGTQTNPVSGVMTFTYLPSGGTSSLPITNLTGTGLVLPLLENNHEWSSGFAVTNTSDEDATLLISCFDLDGTLIQTHTANVTRHGKFISMVQDIADSELPERVIMTIESSVPITGFALSFSIGNTMIIAVPAFIY